MKHVSLDDTFSHIVDDMVKDWKNSACIDIYLHYISDFSNAKKIRDIAESVFQEIGIPDTWKTRFILMLDELNNNAIEHGSAQWDENIFHICLQAENSTWFRAQISATDTGNGTQHKTAQEMEKIRAQHENEDFSQHRSIRGRGLFLIIAPLVDELYFQDSQEGGLEVGFVKVLEEMPV